MKKRIGILIGQIAQIGGVAVAAFEEVKTLRNLGYDAELLVFYEKNKFKYDDFIKDVPVRWLSREYPCIYRINFKIPFFSFFSLFHILSGPAASEVINKGEYDILVCHETYNCLAALTLKKRLKIPYIGYIWDPISYILPRVYKKRFLSLFFSIILPLGRYFDRKIALNSVKIITCSRLHINLLDKLIKEEGRIDILYPGCFPDEVLPPDRENFILALTKWDIGKKPFFLLDVLQHIKNKDIKMIIAGNWVQHKLREAFIEETHKRNLERRIEFIDRVNNKDKAELYSKAKVLVHPIIEAFGMMCLEAAGYGCPFIIPRGSGVTELFPPDKYIVFPEEGDVNGFVSSINNFLDDEKLLKEKGELAWSIARKYSWQEHGRNLARIIESASL